MAREFDEYDCYLLGFVPVSCVISDLDPTRCLGACIATCRDLAGTWRNECSPKKTTPLGNGAVVIAPILLQLACASGGELGSCEDMLHGAANCPS